MRFRDRGGRLRASDLYLSAGSDGSLATQDLDISIPAVEALVNQHADDLRARMNLPGPDLDVLASYYSSSFGNVDRQIAAGNWVVASFASQFLPEGKARGSTSNGTPLHRVPPAKRSTPFSVRDPDTFTLTSGPRAGLTDDFLEGVSRAYASAVARGERPNKAIAEQTGYPLKTVQRWVYTARQREIMPKGKRGSVG